MYAYLINGRVERLSDAPVEGWAEIDNGEEVMADADWNPWDWRVEDGHAVLEPAIASYKAKLSSTDYIASKASDKLIGCDSQADVIQAFRSAREEYGEVLKNRQSWRDAINRLEAQHDSA